MTDVRFGLPVQRLDVIDGDTLKVTSTLDEYIRLSGIDAPELAKREQRAAAEVVTLAVRKWIARQEYISINPIDYDKYGHRVVCVVNGSEGRDLAGWLAMERLVHCYDGRARQPWTTEELERIEQRKGEFE